MAIDILCDGCGRRAGVKVLQQEILNGKNLAILNIGQEKLTVQNLELDLPPLEDVLAGAETLEAVRVRRLPLPKLTVHLVLLQVYIGGPLRIPRPGLGC